MTEDNDNDDIIAERRAHGRKVLAKINELNRKSLSRAPASERANRTEAEVRSLYQQAMAEKRK